MRRKFTRKEGDRGKGVKKGIWVETSGGKKGESKNTRKYWNKEVGGGRGCKTARKGAEKECGGAKGKRKDLVEKGTKCLQRTEKKTAKKCSKPQCVEAPRREKETYRCNSKAGKVTEERCNQRAGGGCSEKGGTLEHISSKSRGSEKSTEGKRGWRHRKVERVVSKTNREKTNQGGRSGRDEEKEGQGSNQKRGCDR